MDEDVGIRGKVGLIGVVVVALVIAPAAIAGQIAYTHGGDLWAMSDSGSGAHVLLTATKAGGGIGADADFPNYTSLSVQPNGTGIAFDARVPAAGCAATCYAKLDPGLYSLINGTVRRLSGAASVCPANETPPEDGDCESSDTDPAVTATGQIVYLAQSAFATPCSGICGETTTSTFLTVPLSGGAPSDRPMPANCSTTPSKCPQSPIEQGTIASDPADPAKIAYSGNADGIPEACGPSKNTYCNPIDVEDSDGTVNQPSLDDSFEYDGLSFSEDGTLIADIETGDSPGIWVYPSGQSYSSSPVFHYALADAGPGTINSLAFVGSSSIVFSADNNLYEIPSSCWTAAGDTTPACTFNPASPTAGGITQLTSDGTAAAPDAEPSWTSSTAAITGPASQTTPPPPPPPSKLKLTLKVSTSQKLLKQKALIATVECSIACGFAAQGGLQVKGSKKKLLTKLLSATVAANHADKLTLKLSASALKTIKKALQKRKRSRRRSRLPPRTQLAPRRARRRASRSSISRAPDLAHETPCVAHYTSYGRIPATYPNPFTRARPGERVNGSARPPRVRVHTPSRVSGCEPICTRGSHIGSHIAGAEPSQRRHSAGTPHDKAA
jgi:ribosomal protein L28